MEMLPKERSAKVPAELFTGDVRFDVIAAGQEPSRTWVNVVRFAPGTRTAWHCNAVGQPPHVTEGVGLVRSRGGEAVVMRPGTVHTPAGDRHWHGAARGRFMTHLAMGEAPERATARSPNGATTSPNEATTSPNEENGARPHSG